MVVEEIPCIHDFIRIIVLEGRAIGRDIQRSGVHVQAAVIIVRMVYAKVVPELMAPVIEGHAIGKPGYGGADWAVKCSQGSLANSAKAPIAAGGIGKIKNKAREQRVIDVRIGNRNDRIQNPYVILAIAEEGNHIRAEYGEVQLGFIVRIFPVIIYHGIDLRCEGGIAEGHIGVVEIEQDQGYVLDPEIFCPSWRLPGIARSALAKTRDGIHQDQGVRDFKRIDAYIFTGEMRPWIFILLD